MQIKRWWQFVITFLFEPLCLKKVVWFIEFSTKLQYYINVNAKQQKVYEQIFKNPVQSNIVWTDIENLLKSLGANITQGNGSRVRIELNGERAVFHRPHPEKLTDKGAVKSMRRFLENARVKI